MGCERFAHVGKTTTKTAWLLDRDAVAPSDQVPAHLVDAARTEAHREGAVLAPVAGLARMEHIRRDSTRRSNRVDYLALSTDRTHAFLVELKTAPTSLGNKQLAFSAVPRSGGIGSEPKSTRYAGLDGFVCAKSRGTP